MSIEKNQGLIKKQGLTSEELAEIQQLAHLCNAFEGLDLKLNWDTLRTRPRNITNDFLYYKNGQLVGFLAIFSFNSQEGEISGMVHPDHRRRGIFTALFEAAKAECQHRSFARILLIVEQASPGGHVFARVVGASYDHSEYKMALDEPKIPAQFDQSLQFKLAEPEDMPQSAHITARTFDMPESEVTWDTEYVIDSPNRRHYVALLDGIHIGKIEVYFDEHEAIIYGFGVLPEYQRRGYGRQILARTIQDILATAPRQIWLEVQVGNKHALSLYQSCGFKEVGSYEYYQIEL